MLFFVPASGFAFAFATPPLLQARFDIFADVCTKTKTQGERKNAIFGWGLAKAKHRVPRPGFEPGSVG